MRKDSLSFFFFLSKSIECIGIVFLSLFGADFNFKNFVCNWWNRLLHPLFLSLLVELYNIHLPPLVVYSSQVCQYTCRKRKKNEKRKNFPLLLSHHLMGNYQPGHVPASRRRTSSSSRLSCRRRWWVEWKVKMSRSRWKMERNGGKKSLSPFNFNFLPPPLLKEKSAVCRWINRWHEISWGTS